MVRANIKGVFCTYKHRGTSKEQTYWYHRSTGARLRGQPGSDEFIADYAAAEKITRDRLVGTFNGLVREFTLSAEVGKLAPATQADYRRLLTYAEVEFGDMPFAALDDRRVRSDFLAWRDRVAKASGERAADYRLSAISAMLTWAVERGRLENNHLRGFRRLYRADRSDKIWLPEHIEAFMTAAPVELQRALILALHTGQRQGDLLRLTWSAYDGKAISLRQGKTKRRVVIPCTKALRRMLGRARPASTQILTMATGQPWRPYTFRHAWKSAANTAGVQGLHFHDLRGTAVTMLAEAGCTPPEIAAITGHTLTHVSSILDTYLARTHALAEAAIARWENAKGTKFANSLQTGAQTKRKAGVNDK